LSKFLKVELSRTWATKLGYLLARSAFRALGEKMDPRKSNGGVFLGLNGIVIKSHGDTDAIGFANAIDIGFDMVRRDLMARIGENLARHHRDAAVPRAVGGVAS
jgi:glycerol-3-phosphate acyltransferase PlsX